MKKRLEGYLLDNNVYSDAFKARKLIKVEDTPQKYVARHLHLKNDRRIFIPSVAVQETERGLHNPQSALSEIEKRQIRKFVAHYSTVSYDGTAAIIAGSIEAKLGFSNSRYDHRLQNDIQIAAIAISYNLILVTNNESDFARIQEVEPRLKIQNWAKMPMTRDHYLSKLQCRVLWASIPPVVLLSYFVAVNSQTLLKETYDPSDSIIVLCLMILLMIFLAAFFASLIIQIQRWRNRQLMRRTLSL